MIVLSSGLACFSVPGVLPVITEDEVLDFDSSGFVPVQ
jgi:hypothetical protein